MTKVEMVMFDLAGTTVRDDNYVALCLHRAATDVGIGATIDEIGRNIGTNKRDLYRMLIARERGHGEAHPYHSEYCRAPSCFRK